MKREPVNHPSTDAAKTSPNAISAGPPETGEATLSVDQPGSSTPAEFDATLTRGPSSSAPGAGGISVSSLSDYELLAEIARGGMGIVYKARHRKLNRIVALKVTRAGQHASKVEEQRFLAEAEAAAKLDHPNIVPIYEIGEGSDQHFFSMAFVEGESLAQATREGPLPPRRAAELMQQVAEAMAYAHSRGVIHRDLKPSNILLDASGQPRR